MSRTRVCISTLRRAWALLMACTVIGACDRSTPPNDASANRDAGYNAGNGGTDGSDGFVADAAIADAAIVDGMVRGDGGDSTVADAATADAGEQEPVGIKWHPGNYIYTAHPDQPQEVAAALDASHVIGVEVRYFWAQENSRPLETAKDQYDFSGLEENLAAYQAKGKRLRLLIFDQDYWGRECVPSYMRDPNDPDYDAAYQGGRVWSPDRRRCVPKYWVPAVMDRILALYRALGARFDGEPYFESISTHETAAPAYGDAAYSARAYVDQLKREQATLVEAFPHTLAFVGANWTPNLPEVVAAAFDNGLGIEGPDLIVTGSSVTSTTWAYPCYNQAFYLMSYGHSACMISYFGRMPLAMGGQVGLEESIQDGHSMADIYAFAMTDPARLRLTHMAWSQPYQTPGFTFNGTILPHIESVMGDTANVACPENIQRTRGGCVSE